MKTFSIITPVYNGEKYISNCIKAIANADYNLSKIEHIIVDDGSTDKTKSICQRYAKKFKHIKFYSKANGNWGSVINYVRKNKIAHGDYIAVCDADDIILPKAFKIVDEKNNNADLFETGFYRWNGKKRKIKINPYYFLFKRNFVKKSKWNRHNALIVPQSTWIKNKIFYKTKPLREKIPYQDTVLFTNCFLEAKTISFTKKPTCLYWCVRPGNSMSEKKQVEGLKKLTSNFDLYAKLDWINPFVYYVLGSKAIRRFLKQQNKKYSFENKKPDFSGFPFYVKPLFWFLYLILVKKFVKK